MKQFTKKYQVWTYADSAYTFQEFDTLAECIAAPKYSDWYITKSVALAVTEAGETPTGQYIPPPQIITGKDLLGKTDEITDEEKEYARKMAGGPVARLDN